MNENGCRDFVRHRQNIPHDNNQSPYIKYNELEKDKGELSTKNDNLLQKNTNLENQLKNIVQQKILLDNEISDLNEINQKQRQRIDCSQRSLDLKYQFRNQFDLAKQNALFEDEVSNYQSALGVIINFQLSDDDQNYGVKLNNTISELNDNIKKYIINLKQDTVVNMEEIKSPRTVTEYLWIPNNTKVDQTIMKANDDDDDDADVDT
ncbi:hypothetical protein GLOIN_2v1848880 [Rhizophagus irregularis DAOM 181602=DAOM 197198]|nr:hypothetical protein GLOIN_2v1848880 [Rhizophagus irregularis DAOM 181602=DAOM 197198]